MLERATHKLCTRSFLAVRNYHKLMLFDSPLEALLIHLNIGILFVLKHLFGIGVISSGLWITSFYFKSRLASVQFNGLFYNSKMPWFVCQRQPLIETHGAFFLPKKNWNEKWRKRQVYWLKNEREGGILRRKMSRNARRFLDSSPGLFVVIFVATRCFAL